MTRSRLIHRVIHTEIHRRYTVTSGRAEPIRQRSPPSSTTSLKFSETELTAIDNAAKRLGLTRSAFIRRACDNEIMAIA